MGKIGTQMIDDDDGYYDCQRRILSYRETVLKLNLTVRSFVSHFLCHFLTDGSTPVRPTGTGTCTTTHTVSPTYVRVRIS
jgi:hypothetical protein